jgi:hypothetical protein
MMKLRSASYIRFGYFADDPLKVQCSMHVYFTQRKATALKVRSYPLKSKPSRLALGIVRDSQICDLLPIPHDMDSTPIREDAVAERASSIYARYAAMRDQFIEAQLRNDEAVRFSIGDTHATYLELAAQLATGVANCDSILNSLREQYGLNRSETLSPTLGNH